MLGTIDPLYIASGFFVGLLVGQTGVGGGSLMTPLLILLFGVHPSTAVGTDLLYAAVTKTVGTGVHGLNHTVDWRIVGRLAGGSIPATLITLLVLNWLGGGNSAGGLIAVLLGVMLLLTAGSLFLRRDFVRLMGPVMESLSARTIARLTVLVGVLLGVMVTISSVGAGALGVTALLLLYPRARMAVIVGSDIAHAVPLTLIAGLGHWWIGSVNGVLLLSLLSGSIPGIILGSYAASHVPEWVLRPLLAIVLIIVGARLLF